LRSVDWDDAKIWLAIGFAGNALFFSRFVVQWIASERAGRSYVPIVFWWLSIAGSLVLLLYAIHRRDPVFVLAYLPNCVVYVRNLMLIRAERLRISGVALPTDLVPDPDQAVSTTTSTDTTVSGAPSRA
jgi:lipid-A-disaccharide synthase-like uncharacterized protein